MITATAPVHTDISVCSVGFTQRAVQFIFVGFDPVNAKRLTRRVKGHSNVRSVQIVESIWDRHLLVVGARERSMYPQLVDAICAEILQALNIEVGTVEIHALPGEERTEAIRKQIFAATPKARNNPRHYSPVPM